MRLDKFFTENRISSRSDSKRILKSGRVKVNGLITRDGSFQLRENDVVSVDKTEIVFTEYQYIMLNKPAGCVTATEDKGLTVMDYLPAVRHAKLAPVGRLDKDTEGLLLITDDGELNHALLSPARHVNKTYFARVSGKADDETIRIFKGGMDIGEKANTAPAELKILGFEGENESLVTVTITEGKFHQIKRMFHRVGMEVIYLKRISMGPLKLDESLAPGQWRMLSEEELCALKE